MNARQAIDIYGAMDARQAIDISRQIRRALTALGATGSFTLTRDDMDDLAQWRIVRVNGYDFQKTQDGVILAICPQCPGQWMHLYDDDTKIDCHNGHVRLGFVGGVRNGEN